jgi:hypothetical protein
MFFGAKTVPNSIGGPPGSPFQYSQKPRQFVHRESINGIFCLLLEAFSSAFWLLEFHFSVASHPIDLLAPPGNTSFLPAPAITISALVRQNTVPKPCPPAAPEPDARTSTLNAATVSLPRSQCP